MQLIIYNSYLIIQRKCIGYWYKINPKTEIELLVQSMNRIKLPKHLVVLGEKEGCIQDSIRIITWCIMLDIPCVSFFGQKDFLTQHESAIKEEFAIRKPELMEYIHWNLSHVPHRENGITESNSKVEVSLICNNSGKGGIVSLTQNLAQAITMKVLRTEEINEKFICEKMTLKGIPDPDLALIHGHVCSTYGFLPWHTRTTEFFMLPVCQNVSVKDFIGILEKYSKCEQRYGE